MAIHRPFDVRALVRDFTTSLQAIDVDTIGNVMGFIWPLVVIFIASLPPQLFRIETMPNQSFTGMVKPMVGLESGSAERLQSFPLTIIGLFAYCVTFIAMLTYAVCASMSNSAKHDHIACSSYPYCQH